MTEKGASGESDGCQEKLKGLWEKDEKGRDGKGKGECCQGIKMEIRNKGGKLERRGRAATERRRGIPKRKERKLGKEYEADWGEEMDSVLDQEDHVGRGKR